MRMDERPYLVVDDTYHRDGDKAYADVEKLEYRFGQWNFWHGFMLTLMLVNCFAVGACLGLLIRLAGQIK